MQCNPFFLQKNKQSAYRRYAYSGAHSLSWLRLSSLLITACTPANRHFNQIVAMAMPENTLTDYQTMTCSQLWKLTEKETKVTRENTLYWVRIMHCTEQLNAREARRLAENFPQLSWSDALKRDLLINKAGPSVNERYTMVKHVDSYRHELPHTLVPIIQLWREQQVLQLLLIQEKARYQRLQSAADIEIGSLREHETRLQHKLANLTDIEHQLSARKQLQHENTMAGIADTTSSTTIPAAEKNMPEIQPGTMPSATLDKLPAKITQQEAPLIPYVSKTEPAHPGYLVPEVNNTSVQAPSSSSSDIE